MLSDLQHQHVIHRLKIVHASGLAVVTMFFVLFFFLSTYTGVNTTTIQMILLGMGVCIALGYIAVLLSSEKIPSVPLALFFVLNLLTTALIWATGVFQSPFIALYIIIILITAQLYHYKYGLLQTIVSFCGLVFVAIATTNLILPYRSLTPPNPLSALYQPTLLVIIQGLIYAILFIFAVLSSSSARILLFRPTYKSDLDSTYQEHIIHTMPLGIFIVDKDLYILGSNPAAAEQFPTSGNSNKLTDYLSLTKINPKETLLRLGKTGEEKQLTWKLDTGEIVPITISVDTQKSSHHADDIFILFVR